MHTKVTATYNMLIRIFVKNFSSNKNENISLLSPIVGKKKFYLIPIIFIKDLPELFRVVKVNKTSCQSYKIRKLNFCSSCTSCRDNIRAECC